MGKFEQLPMLQVEPEFLTVIAALAKRECSSRLDPPAGVDVEMKRGDFNVFKFQLGSMG